MDFIPSMFQFDLATDQELFQLISTFPCKLDQHDYQYHHHDQIKDDHDQVHPPTPSQDDHVLTHKPRRQSSVAFGEKGNDRHHDHHQNPNDDKKKKLIHRDMERQRRQDMGALYASLRSLIPLEYLKGKRSISDQMHGATNHIKDLQKKIQELSEKRDELRKFSHSISTPSANSSANNNNIAISDNIGQNSKRDYNTLKTTISVRHCRGGVEVVVNTAIKQGLPLARVLRVLVAEGLNVVNCVSAKVNERFLHTIKSEAVGGERSMDLPELEKKLKNLIK